MCFEGTCLQVADEVLIFYAINFLEHQISCLGKNGIDISKNKVQHRVGISLPIKTH